MSNEPLLIRASEAGKLMIGGNTITESQLRDLEVLQYRKDHEGEKDRNEKTIAPLTPKMEEERLFLIAKRDAPFELGATAKSLVRDIWLRREFGYDEPVMTPQLFKGLLCEQDSIGVVSRQLPATEFRVKNMNSFHDEFFTGNPDIVLRGEDTVEDIKTSWTVKTFVEAAVPEEYYGQGQVYMHLTGMKHFRLIYVLVDTPAELVLEEHKRFFFKFGADDENPHYQEACEKLDRMHYPSRFIPEEKRIKVFSFDYDPEYIAELARRVIVAREYYATLKL